MDFDGNQPIRTLFWNDEMMFTKQKYMVIKMRERENQKPFCRRYGFPKFGILSLSVVSLSQGAS
jgi:hypothetical protein